MRLHLYEQGTELPTTLEVSATDRLRDVIEIDEDDYIAWVEDDLADDAADELPTGEAADQAADDAAGLAAADVDIALESALKGRASIAAIRNPLKKVRIDVTYSGTTVEFKVSGAATVRKVRRRAIRKLHIDASTAADLTLRIPGREADLDLKRPIGSYVPKGTTALELDLIPIVRPQG